MSVQCRVQAGQPLRITDNTFNTLLDVARASELNRIRQIDGPDDSPLPSGMAWVRNDSGADRVRFDPIVLWSPLFTPATGPAMYLDATQMVWSGQAPSQANAQVSFGVLIEPCASGKLARAVVGGFVQALVQVVSDQHPFCDILPGQSSRLVSGMLGRARILWTEPVNERATPGIARAWVRLGTEASVSIDVQLIAWQQIGNLARWKYGFEEVQLVGDAYQVVTGGQSGSTSNGYALNTIEAVNGAQRAGTTGDGVNQAGSAYPAGFTCRPIGGGTGVGSGVPANRTVVPLRIANDAAGIARPVFTVPNTHDGTCP